MLEETYDVQLILRSPRGLKLTDAGAALLTVARQIFSLEEQAVGILQAEGNEISGKLRVGTVGPFFVMELLSALNQKYPLMQVFLESGNSDVVYSKLLNYEVDVAIIGRDYEDPRLELVQLGRHEVIVFVNKDHPWGGSPADRTGRARWATLGAPRAGIHDTPGPRAGSGAKSHAAQGGHGDSPRRGA